MAHIHVYGILFYTMCPPSYKNTKLFHVELRLGKYNLDMWICKRLLDFGFILVHELSGEILYCMERKDKCKLCKEKTYKLTVNYGMDYEFE